MDQPVPGKVRISQKDIGLGIALLGASYIIPGYSYLSYIGFALGLAAIVILFYRRHSMSISQGRSLYAGILAFAITVIGVVVAFIFYILSLLQYLLSNGFNGTTGSIPPSVLSSILNFSLYVGIGLAASTVFCYFIVVYFYTSGSLKTGIIVFAVVSLIFKFADIFLMTSNFSKISNSSLPGFIALINGIVAQPPFILLTIASSVTLGGFIIYLGLKIYTGRMNPLPELDQKMF